MARIPSNLGLTTVGWLLVLSVVGIYSSIEALYNTPINTDAGYYLLAAKYVRSGLEPYRDFTFYYTPAPPYLIAWTWEFLCRTESYECALLVVLLADFLCALLVWVLLDRVSPRSGLGLAGAVYTLVLIHRFEGGMIVLEPFVLLPALAAFLVLLRSRHSSAELIAIGGLSGAAFLAKQYGILVLLPIAGYLSAVSGSIGSAVRMLSLVGVGW